MKKFNESLLKKSLLAIIIIALSVPATFFLSYNLIKAHAKNAALRDIAVIAESYKGQVCQFLEMTRRRAQDFASDGFIRTRLLKEIRGSEVSVNNLSKYLAENKITLDESIKTIHVLSMEGRVVASTDNAEIGKDLSNETFFIKGKDAITLVENPAGHEGMPELAVSAPIFSMSKKKAIGVLLNTIRLSELNKILSGEYRKELHSIPLDKGRWKSMEVYLVNRDKRMITNSIFVKDAVLKQIVNTFPVVTGLTTKKEVAEFYKDYRGVMVAGASKPIPQLEWILLTEIDEDEILSFMKLMLMSAPIPAGIIIIAGIVLFILFFKTNYKCADENLSAEKKRMEEEQNALREQLYHSQKLESVGTLAGGIAHDFNNILAIIIGYGNLLEKSVGKNNPSQIYIQKILKSAERATHLTQGLLAFSRKQGGCQKPISISRILLAVNNLLLRLIGENIVLDIVPAKEDCVVMADCGQMEQVLINLATNARDAMPNGGKLIIRADIVELGSEFIRTHGYGEIGAYARISVTDTGIGMDKETQRRIFQPFFTTKEVGKGTGLGLSIVYGIAKQHGGYINVESEPGKGATFRIYLPLAKSTVEEGKQISLPAYLNGTEMILLAEDEEEVRNLAKSLLEEAGYKVIAAVNGYDTINKFMENKDNINLLLLDVIMPTKNGREAYEEIRKIRPDIKALFMSGYSESVIHQNTIIKEGLHFISKPFSQTTLLKKVREILDNSIVSI